MSLKDEIKGFVKEYPFLFLLVPLPLIYFSFSSTQQFFVGGALFVLGMIYGSIKKNGEEKDELCR